MKISINDENGTSCVVVLNKELSNAIEGVDFIQWEGVYHKNGKWSYTEGGIGIKNGGFVVLARSKHSRNDKTIQINVVSNDKITQTFYLDRIEKLNERPKFSGENKIMANALFDAYLCTLEKEMQSKILEKWETNSNFF
jgi:hypothetical protein